MEKKRLTASEREALMALNVAAQVTDGCAGALEKRLKGVVRGKMHLGAAKFWIEKVFADVVGTVPEEQLLSYRRNMRGCSYTVGVKSPAGLRCDDYGVWIDNGCIHALRDACRDRCLVCEMDAAGRRKCELRRALGEMSTVEDGGGECPWWGGI